MIGKRVRFNRQDSYASVGDEGVVTRLYSAPNDVHRQHAWYVRLDKNGYDLPTYQSWFDVIDDTPDETESYFV